MSSNRDDRHPDSLERLPHDGLVASWTSTRGLGDERLTIEFENEAWTAQGVVSGIDIHYVIRLSAFWKVQQMLLFRDLDEPDLWLANDGRGTWGEINGAQRRELGGCEDVDVSCSAFTRALAIRRLSLEVGGSCSVHTVVVDPETLGVDRALLSYTRLAARTWSIEGDDRRPSHLFDVDAFGLPLDIPDAFVRTC